jgi:3-dehydroquinate dehydratase-2
MIVSGKKILVLNGSNLNLVGERESGIYGTETWEIIRGDLENLAKESNIELVFFQSNHEGELIDFLQKNKGAIDMALVNPGGFTHYSVSLRDALLAVEIPFIEVHLSNIAAREPFRHQSLFSDIAEGIVSGFQGESYVMALGAAIRRMNRESR